MVGGFIRTSCCHAGVPLVERDVGRSRGAGCGVDYFSEDGVKLFRCAYDSNGGIVRMRQINDLVIITNSNRLPVKLTNRGGVYDVAEITWDHYPLEGSFNQSFPLSFPE